MKRLFAVAVLVALFLGSYPAVMQAQQEVVFGTEMKARVAMELGRAGFYKAHVFGGHRDLGHGETRVVLEQPKLFKMVVVGGDTLFVWQPAGDEFVADSTGKIVRRWDCGNWARLVYTPSLLRKMEPPATIYNIDNRQIFNITPNADVLLPPAPQGNWLERNWEWAVPVAILVGVGVYALATSGDDAPQPAPGPLGNGDAIPPAPKIMFRIGTSF